MPSFGRHRIVSKQKSESQLQAGHTHSVIRIIIDAINEGIKKAADCTMILHAWRDILQSCSITDDDDLQTKTFFVFAPNKTNLTPDKNSLGYGRNPANYVALVFSAKP